MRFIAGLLNKQLLQNLLGEVIEPCTHVRAALAARAPAQLSRKFDCSAQTIANWVVQAARDQGKPLPGKAGLSGAEREELARLRRQVRQLQMERDILAKRRLTSCGSPT